MFATRSAARIVFAVLYVMLLAAASAATAATVASAPSRGDTERPSVPGGLAATVLNDRAIQLTWLPSTDNVGVTGYKVYDRGEEIAQVPGVEFTHYRLRANSTYRYIVRAFDAAGNLSNQQPQQLVVDTGDTTPPLSPAGFTAIPINEESVRLVWDPAVDNVRIEEYEICRLDGSPCVRADFQFYVVNGLEASTTYGFTLTAIDSVGLESAPTPVLHYTTPDLTRPADPTGLVATVLDDSRVLLQWNPSTDNVGVAGYSVLDFGEEVGQSAGPKFIHSGLEPESMHNYKVKALDAAGNLSFAELTVTVNTGDTTPPTTPSGFAATVVDDTTILLSWQPSEDNVGVDRYELVLPDAPPVSLTGTTFEHTMLTPMTDYQYSIVALDDDDNASGSAGASANTGDTTPPTVPGAFALDIIDDTSLRLSWLESTDNVAMAGYEVLADGVTLLPVAGTEVLLQDLSPAVSVSYAVRAIDHADLPSTATAPIVASPTDDTTVPLLDEPFLPVLAALNINSRPEPEHSLTSAELDAIASNYHGLWGSGIVMPPATELDYLRSQRAGFFALAYLNSSHTTSSVSDNEQAEAERLKMINVYLEAYLDAPVDAQQTTLNVRPADTERGWGLIASTTAGESTTSAQDYVTYLRIDDELMRIEAVNPTAGTVTVTRGFQASDAAPHDVDAPVLAPVYTGPGNGTSGGVGQSIPGNTAGVLPAYSLQVGTFKAGQFFAAKTEALMDEGPDGAWLDICSPKFFNQVSAVGEAVVPWNLESGAPFTDAQRRNHQDRKLGRMQDLVLSSSGRWPMLAANNNANGKYFDFGGRAMDFLLPTSSKPTPVESVVLENAFSQALGEAFFAVPKWQRNLSTIMHGGQNGLPVWPWIKTANDDYREDSGLVDSFEQFDYAGVLLGWELDAAEAYISLPLFRASGAGRELNLSEWLFYDFGEPVDQVAWDAYEQLIVPDTNTYLRRWTNGAVLVNPTDTADASVPLPGQYLVPATGQKVSSIGVPAHSAVLLIRDD